MKNKDIKEWLSKEGINPEASITNIYKEYYLSDILEKYLKEQLQLGGVSKSVKKCATCSVNVLVSDDCLSCDENYSEWK